LLIVFRKHLVSQQSFGKNW